MKYWFFSIVIFFAIFNEVSAQVETLIDDSSKQPLSLDFGMWGYASEGGFGYASWNMMYVGDNLFEVRHNFDNTNALSLYYGRRIGWKNFSFTPALGFVQSSNYSAVGLTTHSVYEGSKIKLYSINQINFASVSNSDNIIYHWVDFGYNLNSWFSIGCSDQYYALGDNDNLDIGPSIGFSFGDFYAKTYAWDFWNNQDRYLGVWCGWYFEL